DLPEQQRAGSSGRIQVTAASDVLLDQLLADADRLEIHAEKSGNRRIAGAPMLLAGDFVQDCLHLECVVALDVLEAVRVRASLRRVGYGSAGHAAWRAPRQRYNRRVDFRGEIVVYVCAVARAGYGGVGRMFVGPGRVPSLGVDHTENCVGADEVPRHDGRAV